MIVCFAFVTLLCKNFFERSANDFRFGAIMFQRISLHPDFHALADPDSAGILFVVFHTVFSFRLVVIGNLHRYHLFASYKLKIFKIYLFSYLICYHFDTKLITLKGENL